jgi:hypothetical protein
MTEPNWREMYRQADAERTRVLTLLMEARLHLAYLGGYVRNRVAPEVLEPIDTFIDAGIMGDKEKVQ